MPALTSRTVRGLIALLLLSGALVAARQNPPPAAGTNAAALHSAAPGTGNPPPVDGAPGETTNSEVPIVIKEVRPGIFEIADVRLDKQQRTVSFPARLNLTNGAMEYFLVTTWGKTHESILQTETEPYRIHVAMLLLGTTATGTNSADGRPGGKAGEEAPPVGQFISHPSKARLPGDDITLEVKWTVNGKETRRMAEQMVFNREKKAVLGKGAWVYNGSRQYADAFLAEIDGSIVSLITDPAAMINNVAPGHDDDTIWLPNTSNLPPPDVPVEVTIKLIPLRSKR